MSFFYWNATSSWDKASWSLRRNLDNEMRLNIFTLDIMKTPYFLQSISYIFSESYRCHAVEKWLNKLRSNNWILSFLIKSDYSNKIKRYEFTKEDRSRLVEVADAIWIWKVAFVIQMMKETAVKDTTVIVELTVAVNAKYVKDIIKQLAIKRNDPRA